MGGVTQDTDFTNGFSKGFFDKILRRRNGGGSGGPRPHSYIICNIYIHIYIYIYMYTVFHEGSDFQVTNKQFQTYMHVVVVLICFYQVLRI